MQAHLAEVTTAPEEEVGEDMGDLPVTTVSMETIAVTCLTTVEGRGEEEAVTEGTGEEALEVVAEEGMETIRAAMAVLRVVTGVVVTMAAATAGLLHACVRIATVGRSLNCVKHLLVGC
jgi:hypothetical protein